MSVDSQMKEVMLEGRERVVEQVEQLTGLALEQVQGILEGDNKQQ